jgi:2-polyprenyl-3-methyl-5-hydroxy-6-metoxy-1,4-benzoquinol methylase
MWNIVRRIRRWVASNKSKTPVTDQRLYWEQRRQMAYYLEVIRFAREFAPSAQSVLDVGPNGTPLVCELDWIGSKTIVDLAKADIPGAKCIQINFLNYEPEQTFDLVLCLQVLEHVGPADVFARKLLDTGKIVIISVPYCWPARGCLQHVHDPVDRKKLLAWTGKASLTDTVVRDGRRDRLIAVFEGNCQAATKHRAA